MDDSLAVITFFLDKLIIPLTLAFVGYLIKSAIENSKRDNELKKNAGLKRFEVYKDLWLVSEITLYKNSNILNKDKLREKLRSWYYADGNGLWININSADILLSLIEKLKSAKLSDDEITSRLSKLRTQLKVDVMTYTIKESKIPIGNK